MQRATPHHAVSYVCIIHYTCLTDHMLLRLLSIGTGCAGDEKPAGCMRRLRNHGLLVALAAQEDLETLFGRALNAQKVVDLKKPPA